MFHSLHANSIFKIITQSSIPKCMPGLIELLKIHENKCECKIAAGQLQQSVLPLEHNYTAVQTYTSDQN